MKSFTFFVDGRPRGKGRPRMTKTGHVYTPKETAAYESEIRQAFLKRGGESMCGLPVSVRIEADYPMPQSWSKKQREEARGTYADRKPDWDNIEKAVLDALNGLAWSDDKSVVVLIARKKWADTGGVEITITDMSD